MCDIKTTQSMRCDVFREMSDILDDGSSNALLIGPVHYHYKSFSDIYFIVIANISKEDMLSYRSAAAEISSRLSNKNNVAVSIALYNYETYWDAEDLLHLIMNLHVD